MPVYDYFCSTCGYQFERRVSAFANHDVSECPNCAATAQRKFSVPAVIFKGSGFYKTDHRSSTKSDSPSSRA